MMNSTEICIGIPCTQPYLSPQVVADFFHGAVGPCHVQALGVAIGQQRFQVLFIHEVSVQQLEINVPYFMHDPTCQITYFNDFRPETYDSDMKGAGKGMICGPMKGDKGFGKGDMFGHFVPPPLPRDPEAETCIHVGNIHPDISVEELLRLFSNCGKVVGYMQGESLPTSFGTAVIEFPLVGMVNHAVQRFNGVQLRPPSVLTVEQAKRKGFKRELDYGKHFGKGPEYGKGVSKGDVFKDVGKGAGKGSAAPLNLVYIEGVPQSEKSDDLTRWVEVRVGERVQELRLYSKEGQSYAFLCMSDNAKAEQLVREVNNSSARTWKAHIVNNEIRASCFPHINPAQVNVYELRIVNESDSKYINEMRLQDTICRDYHVTVTRSCHGQQVFYAQFENQEAVRLAAERYAHGLMVDEHRVSVGIADYVLRPECINPMQCRPPSPSPKRQRLGDMGTDVVIVQLSSIVKSVVQQFKDDAQKEATKAAERAVPVLLRCYEPRMEVEDCLKIAEVVCTSREDTVCKRIIEGLEKELQRMDTFSGLNSMKMSPVAQIPVPVVQNHIPMPLSIAEAVDTPQAFYWSGTLARNNSKQLAISAFKLSGNIDVEFPATLNICHRSPLDEVGRRPVLATFELVSENATAYAEYIKYFLSKQRAGVVSLDKYSLYILPPCALASSVAPRTIRNSAENTLIALVGGNAVVEIPAPVVGMAPTQPAPVQESDPVQPPRGSSQSSEPSEPSSPDPVERVAEDPRGSEERAEVPVEAETIPVATEPVVPEPEIQAPTEEAVPEVSVPEAKDSEVAMPEPVVEVAVAEPEASSETVAVAEEVENVESAAEPLETIQEAEVAVEAAELQDPAPEAPTESVAQSDE